MFVETDLIKRSEKDRADEKRLTFVVFINIIQDMRGTNQTMR